MRIYANGMAEEQNDQKIPTHGSMIGTDDEIKLGAVQRVRLIQRGLLEERKVVNMIFH
jgi:hypothetical protein